jgi:purine-binding chemotaxis protein CheW
LTQKSQTSIEDSASRWEAILQRLEKTRLALEQEGRMEPHQKEAILQARAKQLASAPESQPIGQEWLELVEFQLANERYAIASNIVREVFPLREITPLPGLPPFVRGIINVRGHLWSVIDLKRFFDLPDKGITDLNKVILIANAGMELGILADVVFGICHIPVAAIQPALPTLTGIRAEYLQGLTADRLIVLDAVKILADPRIVVRDEVEM